MKIWKAAKLDFNLLKYYYKSICFTLLIPLAFILLYRTLAVGISFAMFMMAMSSIYTFLVADKNDMQRLYRILPVSVKALVCGKYLHAFLMGILAVSVSGILQPMILGMLGVNVSGKEVMTAVLAGMVLYITYVCFQIPAYYKFGPIKGRVFMYVPVVGILLTMFVVEKADIRTGVLFRMLSENRYLGPCLLVLYLAAVVCISIGISVRISKNKEW
ncbi:ABC-2 transporter permease [Clostridia bacterium UC5.1-1D4]|nr:ABC-2 transporter permease [Clostridia bacterium UC5.1-1D4]